MFCKKCGKEIKPGAAYCPSCGTAVAASSGAMSGAGLSVGPLSPGTVPRGALNTLPDRDRRSRFGGRRFVLPGIVIAAAVVIVVAALIVIPKLRREEVPKAEYSVTGTWASDDLEELGGILEDILYENLSESLGDSVARLVSEGIGGMMDQFSGALEVVFRDNGALEIYVADMALEVVSLSYEMIDESEMKLTMKFKPLNIPYLGEMELPTISYKAEYFVAKKWLTLDFFGYELEFTRKK